MSDRGVSASRMRQLDESCATPAHQVRYWSALAAIRGAVPVPSQDPPGLVLGRTVRRWAPKTVERRTGVAVAHTGRILTALQTNSAPVVAAAISDAYSDAYSDDDGNDPASSSRLGKLVDGALKWAGALLAYMATPNANDDLQIADDTADVCQTAGESASTLDTIESGGGSSYRIVVQDGCCAECADDEGDHDISEDCPIPHHACCLCRIATEKDYT